MENVVYDSVTSCYWAQYPWLKKKKLTIYTEVGKMHTEYRIVGIETINLNQVQARLQSVGLHSCELLFEKELDQKPALVVRVRNPYTVRKSYSSPRLCVAMLCLFSFFYSFFSIIQLCIL